MRMLAALVMGLSAGPGWGAESWAPPLSAFRDRSALPGVRLPEQPALESQAIAILTEINPRLRPGAEAAIQAEAQKRGWPVLRWKPGLPITSTMSGDEVIVMGGNGDAGKAVRALIRLFAKLDTDRPLVIRYPVDAIYGEWQSLGRLEDPAGFYATHLVPDWLPADADIAPGTLLRLELLRHGRLHTQLSRGSGKRVSVVKLDITDLRSLQPLPKPARADVRKPQSRKPGSGKLSLPLLDRPVAGLPGTPLDSRQEPGLWFGQGDRGHEGAWGTAGYGSGGVRRAHAEGLFRNIQADGSLGSPNDALGMVTVDYQDQDGVARGVLDVGLLGKTLGGSLRVLSHKAGLDSHMLLRGAVNHRLALGAFRNDLTGKAGYLHTESGLQGGGGSLDRGQGQLLWGAGDVMSLGLDLKRLSIVAEAGAEAVWSRLVGETKWDNYRLHGGVEATVPLRDDLHLMAQYKHRVLENNPEKYFFSTSKTDDQALGGLSYRKAGLGAGVMGGVQVIRGEQANDHRKKAGAWVRAFDTTLTGFAGRGEWTQELTVALARKVSKDWEVEAYVNRDSMVRYDYKQDTLGMRVAWGFGGGSAARGLPDERRYRSRPDDLYAQRFYEDKRLPLETFKGQMDSVRKANEFAGKNLTWVTGDEDKWARTPSETYGGRAGDCDEQAWLVSRALNDNPDFAARGGKALILDYWTPGAGHGVSLVEEGGKVYVNEYGRIYRINVDPSASMDEKAKAALQQVGPYLALRPQSGKPLMYAVFGTKDNPSPPPPGGYDMTYFNDPNLASNWVFIDSFELKNTRPPVETGIGALLGTDAF